MLPAASKSNKKKLPAKVIPLSAREELPKALPVSRSKKETAAKKDPSRHKPDNPFASWVMPPQPRGYENGSDYEFF